MFKRILAAVDGSKTSLKALDKAIELQKLIPDARSTSSVFTSITACLRRRCLSDGPTTWTSRTRCCLSMPKA